jgi:atypical dual specificity phosphatase
MEKNRFSFVIPQCLAGMSCPGISNSLEQDLKWLKEKGIHAIVTLTRENLDDQILLSYNMEYLHIPVTDFAPPTLGQILDFVHFVDSMLDKKKAVAVHCFAGLGRTGTMLACYLVKQGYTPQESIRQIRSLRPGSIESEEQEWAIQDYADYLHR